MAQTLTIIGTKSQNFLMATVFFIALKCSAHAKIFKSVRMIRVSQKNSSKKSKENMIRPHRRNLHITDARHQSLFTVQIGERKLLFGLFIFHMITITGN